MDRLRGLVFDHRRMLAAVCAGLAVLTALASIRVEAPERRPVVVSSRDLPAGTAVTEDDVRVARVDPDLGPDHAATDTRDVVGQRLAGPMRRGEVITDARLIGPGILLGRPAGTVVATIRVADPVEVEALSVGESVDVMAIAPDGTGPGSQIVAEQLEVVAVDDGTRDPSDTAVVRVATDREGALALAEASVDARISVVTAQNAAS